MSEKKNKGMEALKEYRRKIEAGEIEPTKPEHNYIRRILKKPTSMKTAIGGMCFHCMGGSVDDMEPGWKDEVRDCSAWPPCPLHDWRPFKKAEGEEETFAERMERWKARDTKK